MNICQINVCGGIGNQLFQIATAYSYSERTNKILYINTHGWSASQGTHPSIYKNSIFSNFRYKPENNYIHEDFVDIGELQQMKYTEIPNCLNKNVNLFGYFQCPKYFENDLSEFKTLLLLPNVNTNHIDSKSVAFHIRIGDYRKFSPIFGDITPYFKRMFEKFKGEDIHVYTDSPEVVLQKYKEYDFKLIQTTSDLNDLTMLTKYDRIVCSNSSFSWWGAMLGNAKEILVPDKWIMTVPNADIYTDRMTKYEF